MVGSVKAGLSGSCSSRGPFPVVRVRFGSFRARLHLPPTVGLDQHARDRAQKLRAVGRVLGIRADGDGRLIHRARAPPLAPVQ